MKKEFLMICFLIMGVIIGGCDEEVQNEEVQKMDNYLSFLITCKQNGTYYPYDVAIKIRKNTGEQTNHLSLNGWYATSAISYDDNDKIDIFIYSMYTDKEIMGVYNINPITNPTWFVHKKKDLKSNMSGSGMGHLHIGECDD